MEQARSIEQSAEQYRAVRIVTNRSFGQHEGLDVTDLGPKRPDGSGPAIFQVLKTQTTKAFKRRLSEYFAIPEQQAQLWVFAGRENKTIRPVDIVEEAAESTREWL